MKNNPMQKGYTLVELMVAVGILAVLVAIAVPSYNSYISTSALATTRTNAKILAGFLDTYFYENDSYVTGDYDPPGTDTLTGPLDWKPTGDNDQFAYKVEAGATGITNSYKITVSYKLDPSISTVINHP